MYRRVAALTTAALLSVFALFTVVSAQFKPDVFVLDQAVVDGMVKVSRAVINEPGWIVIHADNGGEIGAPIGQAPLTDGINAQVSVAVDVDSVTDALYAMLHTDAGVAGTYEFPDGPDVPLLVDGEMVSPAFAVMGIENTVVGTAINAGSFDTLVAAIEAAGLIETLQGDGPFTVFAPTDEAFAKLPAGTVDALLEDPETLSGVLLHHVVAEETLSNQLEDGLNLASIQGAPLTIAIDSVGPMVNGASITAADIEAFNGVIHVIDTVMLPPANGSGGDESSGTSESTSQETDSSTEESSEESTDSADFGDIVETAIAADGFNTLVAAVQAADLVATLQSEGPFTVLAPTDAAFAELPEDQLAALLESPDELADILLYHVIPGSTLSTDLVDGLEVATAQGASVTFGVGSSGATVNGSNILVADILASNGIIHAIDKVLLPPADGVEEAPTDGDDSSNADEDSEDSEDSQDGGNESDSEDTEESSADQGNNGATGDIISIASGSEDFSLLTTAIIAAGLETTLRGDGPFTVFAPNDDAFAKLPEGAVDALLADRDALIDLLFYHVVSGNLQSPGISDGLSVTTLQGSDIAFSVTANGVGVNDANVIAADVAATNGVIHVIDMVLLPVASQPEPTPVPPTPVPATPLPPTPTPDPNQPVTIPQTGGSFGGFGTTLPLVSLMLVALFAVALWERKVK